MHLCFLLLLFDVVVVFIQLGIGVLQLVQIVSVSWHRGDRWLLFSICMEAKHSRAQKRLVWNTAAQERAEVSLSPIFCSLLLLDLDLGLNTVHLQLQPVVL